MQHFWLSSIQQPRPLSFWSYLPDSIGPTTLSSDVSSVGRQQCRTSALSDVGRRTKWERGIWQFKKNTPKWFSKASKSMRLARWVVGHWRMCRVARGSISTTTGTGNFVVRLWKSTSLTAWLIWFWISALRTWSRGRRLWKRSLRLGFNWVTDIDSFKQCIHESRRQCCNSWNFNSHPSKWLCTQDAYLQLYARKGLTSMSDMIVLELAHPKWIHKDDDPTEPLPPNRKRKRQTMPPTLRPTVIEIQDSAHASWKVGGGVQQSDILTGVHTCWPA